MISNPFATSEGLDIIQTLKTTFPNEIEGKEAVQYLKSIDCKWRQSEWIGFYIEVAGRDALIRNLGGSFGDRFGNTAFDYKKSYNWDIKAHSHQNPKGNHVPWAILNDLEAIQSSISQGGVGFVVCCGSSKFDLDGQFKIWHDNLKGKTSSYELTRIERNAPSRTRKVSFDPIRWICFFIETETQLEDGIKGGWFKYFQEGMRNADGSPRRKKIMANLDLLPVSIVLKS